MALLEREMSRHLSIYCLERDAINAFRSSEWVERIRTDGAAWGSMKAYFKEILPKDLDNRDDIAYKLVGKALVAVFGAQGTAWHSFKHPTTGATWAKSGTAK